MEDRDALARLLVAALYEVRLFLGTGSMRPDGLPVNQAAGLAYMLHNDALALLEGRDVSVEDTWERLARLDTRLGMTVSARLRERLAQSEGLARDGSRAAVSPDAAIASFASVARDFCALVEGGTHDAMELVRSLAALHLAVFDLPAVVGEDEAPEPGEVPVCRLDLLIDLYWIVLDPLAMTPGEPGVGSLYDDISDIRLDLRRGLELYDLGFPLAAAWYWRFHFQAHWGDHLVDAQQALHRALW